MTIACVLVGYSRYLKVRLCTILIPVEGLFIVYGSQNNPKTNKRAAFIPATSSGVFCRVSINYIHLLGLESEVIDIPTAMRNNKISDCIIADISKSYIKAGMPIVAEVQLVDNDKEIPDYHAVVICGYRCDQNGDIKELYVHDDQIGPYSRAIPDGNFTRWKNEWTTDYGYDELSVIKLLIPVYPKIRLTFSRIYDVYLEQKQRILSKGFDPELYLTQVKDYKKYLLEQSIEEKEKILTAPLPRFLWIIRIYNGGTPVIDYIFDGTAVFPKNVCTVRFLH